MGPNRTPAHPRSTARTTILKPQRTHARTHYEEYGEEEEEEKVTSLVMAL